MFRPLPGSLKTHIAFALLAATLAPGLALAQPKLTLEEAIRAGISASPQVNAAEADVSAAQAAIRKSRAGFNTQVELAPGAGFTNGNTALSQRFDISGVTSASVLAAIADLGSAEGALAMARQQSAVQIGREFASASRAKAELIAAEEAESLAERLADLVRKRVEVGESPQVQASRAALEALRVGQDVVRARADLRSRLDALKTLLGMPELTAESLAELPEPPSYALAELLQSALGRRGEVLSAKWGVDQARSLASLARAERGPTLSAGIAADVWSLDRDPFQSRNLGFQTFLSFPLFDRGSFRAEDAWGAARIRAAEARVRDAERSVRIELAKAIEELNSRKAIAATYQTRILPDARSVADATQKGFETGVSSLIDVLEAQRTLRLIASEALKASHDAWLAEIEVRRAAGRLAPISEPEKKN